MRHHLNRIQSMLRPWLANLPRYATNGAWFFALGSMLPLLWLMLEGHGEGGTSYVFGNSVNGVPRTVWGLTYAGALGTMLLWLEFFALTAATVLSALPNTIKLATPQTIARFRCIGLAYLTAWAGLWMVGTMYLATVSPGFWIVQAAFLTALFACTVYRTVREWPVGINAQHQNPITLHDDEPQLSPAFAAHDSQSVSRDTDTVDVARFSLQRSAVRPSDRVRELEPSRSELYQASFTPLHLRLAPNDAEPDNMQSVSQRIVSRARDAARIGLRLAASSASRLASAIQVRLAKVTDTTAACQDQHCRR